MHVADKTGWSDVIYRLLYPSILGSMLYDLLPLWREPSFKWFLVAKTAVVVLYVLAYIHAYRDLDVAGPQQRGGLILCDAVLAFLFGFAYIYVMWGNLRLTGICILAAAVILFFYPCPREVRGALYWTSKGLFLAAAIALTALTFSLAREGGWLACWSIVGVTGVYALHVFLFTELSRRPASAAEASLE